MKTGTRIYAIIWHSHRKKCPRNYTLKFFRIGMVRSIMEPIFYEYRRYVYIRGGSHDLPRTVSSPSRTLLPSSSIDFKVIIIVISFSTAFFRDGVK